MPTHQHARLSDSESRLSYFQYTNYTDPSFMWSSMSSISYVVLKIRFRSRLANMRTKLSHKLSLAQTLTTATNKVNHIYKKTRTYFSTWKASLFDTSTTLSNLRNFNHISQCLSTTLTTVPSSIMNYSRHNLAYSSLTDSLDSESSPSPKPSKLNSNSMTHLIDL
jgi:hypothetical protein